MGVLSLRIDTTATVSLTASSVVAVMGSVPTQTGFHSETGPAVVPVTLTDLFAGIPVPISTSETISTATSDTVRLTRSEVTITPPTTFSVNAGGSIAGVRGAVTLTAGKTFTDGFLYGTQGKVTLAGTMNETSAARIAGVIGQVDLASGTVTDGQVSAVWADVQATSPTLTDASQINVLRVTNSTSSTLNAMAFFYGQASYFATMGRDGGDPTYFGATAPTGLAKSLKVKVGSTDYYVPLYTAAS